MKSTHAGKPAKPPISVPLPLSREWLTTTRTPDSGHFSPTLSRGYLYLPRSVRGVRLRLLQGRPPHGRRLLRQPPRRRGDKPGGIEGGHTIGDAPYACWVR